jgi:hypothetical protein
LRQRILLPILVHEDDGERSVHVDFDDESIPPWCLDLCLLSANLVGAVSVSDQHGGFRLQIRVDRGSRRGRVEWRGGEPELWITETELELWVHFFLQYYRDGIAAVDHIDVELPASERAGGPDLFLTLAVPLARPAGTAEQAREALSLEQHPSKRGAHGRRARI